MTTIRFPRRLTIPAWENAVGPGDPLAGTAELRLDFGQVEFADFGALARALLLVDAAVRAGVTTEIALPSEALPGEPAPAAGSGSGASAAEARSQFNRRARARRDTRVYMRHIGFLNALRAPHWPDGAVRTVEAGRGNPRAGRVREAAPADDAADDAPRDARYRPRRIMPLQWVPSSRGGRLHESDAFHAALARLAELGMAEPGGRMLSETLLTELVENVDAHAAPAGGRPPAALVGAILLDSDTFVIRRRDLPAELGEVADRSAEDGGRVLRLVVGDAGRGLLAGLASRHSAPDRASGGDAADEHPASAQEVILSAIEKWSTGRHEVGAAQRGVRGLSRVATVVRAYGGSVTIRSSDVMAGLLYGRSREGRRVALDGLGPAVGTLAEVAVLADSRSTSPGLPWSKFPLGPADSRLSWVECTLDLERGLTADSVRRLEGEAARVRNDPGYGGIVATVPIGSIGREPPGADVHAALRHAFGAAVRVAGTAAVIMVVPDADRLLLDLAISEFETDDEQADREDGTPVLILGASGEAAWCGGTPELRGLLAWLLAAGGARPLREAEGRWRDGGGAPDGFQAMLRGRASLLSTWSENLALRISPLNAVRVMEDAVHHRLADAVRDGGPGVTRGRFRGPTLGIANRWIDVDRLLAATIGPEIAAFVLARKVERRVGALPPDGAVMTGARTRGVRAVATRFSRNLLLGGGCHATPGDFDLDGFAAGDRVRDGTRVILCEDMLFTENSVRRTAAGLVTARTEPVAIVCVIDAREERGPVRILNRTIPVIALTGAGLREPGEDAGAEAAEAVNIDPITWRPQPPAVPRSEPLPEDELMRRCMAVPETLRLGHVEGPRRMHFSAVLQLDPLLQHAEHNARITDAILDTVRDAREELAADGDDGLDGAPAQIWHPGPATEPAAHLASAVRQRMAVRGDGDAELVGVPRWPAGNRWIFPGDLGSGAGGSLVIVVDWGAVSSTTLRQMIRLAAGEGAAAVVAVAVLDQLDDQDSQVLRMWRAVEGPARRRTPVITRFLGSSSLTGLEEHDCPMCATRRRYLELVAADTPGRLRRHAELLHEQLRPLDRLEVSRNAAADLFSVPVSGRDMVDYLRWRGLLRGALRDTGRRKEVVDRLHDLARGHAGREWSRDNLLRLLAAEQQWLKLPPLRFGVARDLLAGIDRAGLQKDRTESPWLRAQALTVLAGAAPQVLVELLPRLLQTVLDEAVLVDHMLLECYRLLRRPSHDSPIDVKLLRDNLIQCRERLEALETDGGTAGRRVDDHLRVLEHLITIADHRHHTRPQDPQTAWHRLREDLRRAVRRHRLESDLLHVRDFVEELPNGRPEPAEVRQILRAWRGCERRIDEHALANLPALADVLAGEFVADRLGRPEQERLVGLVNDPNVTELRTFTEKLEVFLEGRWEPQDRSWSAQRREILDKIRWWHHMFLATHLPDLDQPALLVELVESAPTAPRSGLERVLGGEVDDPQGAADAQVFCPAKLLDEVLEHLRENTVRHRVNGAACRVRAGCEFDDANDVRITVRNSGTRPSARPGRGVRSFAERLRPFGATLRTRPLDGDPWTFEAVITLARWTGAGM